MVGRSGRTKNMLSFFFSLLSSSCSGRKLGGRGLTDRPTTGFIPDFICAVSFLLTLGEFEIFFSFLFCMGEGQGGTFGFFSPQPSATAMDNDLFCQSVSQSAAGDLGGKDDVGLHIVFFVVCPPLDCKLFFILDFLGLFLFFLMLVLVVFW
ncbi:hypothetical protein QBC47DRAFT_378829 [Echria macrotheca]|uniref:Uncharacterized protein n=1 Tax=Echria macrotheca TaxID=438768 RepID=A0AAJ0BG52_9PEZI|nr:hypothetical protein QBC47DRAFT_378829 [Echria macrotheca]